MSPSLPDAGGCCASLGHWFRVYVARLVLSSPDASGVLAACAPGVRGVLARWCTAATFMCAWVSFFNWSRGSFV